MKKGISQRPLAQLLCLAVPWLVSQAAHAETSIKISGFGTVGVARTTSDDTQFRANMNQFSGADRNADLGVDTRLGLQGVANFGADFSATAQLLGVRRENDDFDAQFEWLYLQYKGVPGLDLKAGRVALPAFLVSDSRYVGYATPWLRVPTLVYSMMPLSTLEGVQVGYSHSIGPVIASLQVTHGRTKGALGITQAVTFGPSTFYVPVVLDFKSANPTTVINGTIEWDDFTFRLGQLKADTDLTVRGVGTKQYLEDTFREAGFQYDNGKVVVISEYVQRTTDSGAAEGKAWYVGGGYHFGSVLPYAIFSKYSPKTGLDAKGIAGGVRWDFAKNVALKAEYASYESNSFYAFTDAVSPAAADKKVKVVSLALDFVF